MRNISTIFETSQEPHPTGGSPYGSHPLRRSRAIQDWPRRLPVFVTFLCDATQLSMTYCIKSKTEVFDCFRKFKQHYERPGRRIHRLRADNDGEYSSKAMLRYLFLTGITPKFTVRGNPQQNGPAEKLGNAIWNKAKTSLKRSSLPWEY